MTRIDCAHCDGWSTGLRGQICICTPFSVKLEISERAALERIRAT